MQQCDFSSSAFGRRRWECPSSSNLAELEETCLPLPRDSPHREQTSVGSGMSASTSSSACLDRGSNRAVERRYPLQSDCCLSGIRCCSAFILLLQGETAASWHKGLVPKGVQTRTSHTQGLSGEWDRDPSLGYSKPEALDLPAGALCKSWHPGKVLRVVPTPNQHMKSDR